MSRLTTYTAIALSLAAAAGCGPARTAAATQSTIKAFDASKSDPKAVAIADEVLTALGGEANWAKAKEIGFTQLVVVDGKLLDVSKHIWDRWNGRHHFEHLEPKGQWDVTMYEMFGGVSYAYFYNAKAKDNKVANAMKDEKGKLVEEAKKRFDRDVYRVMLPYKLKDPGVKLTYAEELPEEGSPKGSPMVYDEIKITFEPGVGPTPGDTWYLMVRKSDHLPAVIEHVLTGKPDNEREGIKLDDWKDFGGIKIATMQTTLGYTKPDAAKQPVEVPEDWKKDEDAMSGVAGVQAPKPGEIVLIRDVKVEASPNEDNFIPAVD